MSGQFLGALLIIVGLILIITAVRGRAAQVVDLFRK